MKTLRLFTIFLGVFAMGQSGLGADAKVDPNLKAGQAALRSKEYKLAVVALETTPGDLIIFNIHCCAPAFPPRLLVCALSLTPTLSLTTFYKTLLCVRSPNVSRGLKGFTRFCKF